MAERSRRGLVLWASEHAALGEALARGLASDGWVAGEVECRQFPDGEHYVNFIGAAGGLGPGEAVTQALVVGSLDDPDRRWLRLAFLAQAARDFGAARVGWVAPYLGYLRQDERFKPGEVVTARCFARMAAETFDAVWTVAPHLHRVQRLEEVYPIPAHAVSATEAIAAWVRAQVRDPVLVGPDEESAQWVRPVAQALGVPWAVMDKTRHGDRAVEVEAALEAAMFEGRTPVLLDDIASTGQTLIAALHQVRAVTEVAPVCVVIHPVFVPGALEQVRAASQLAFGDVRVVSCDTIPHETNAISVTRALISALLDAQRMGR